MPQSGRSTLTALFRDLAKGFEQQMYFWGRDAQHAEGNLFVRTGFNKRPSKGLKGTSCYRLPWQGGAIELHGSHAGWLGESGGMIYIRPFRRCVHWHESSPPVPGKYPNQCYSGGDYESLYSCSRPFFNWWIAHEEEIRHLTARGYRESCHQLFKKLPRSRPWLPPKEATRWVTGLRDDPANLPRARRFTENS